MSQYVVINNAGDIAIATPSRSYAEQIAARKGYTVEQRDLPIARPGDPGFPSSSSGPRSDSNIRETNSGITVTYSDGSTAYFGKDTPDYKLYKGEITNKEYMNQTGRIPERNVDTGEIYGQFGTQTLAESAAPVEAEWKQEVVGSGADDVISGEPASDMTYKITWSNPLDANAPSYEADLTMSRDASQGDLNRYVQEYERMHQGDINRAIGLGSGEALTARDMLRDVSYSIHGDSRARLRLERLVDWSASGGIWIANQYARDAAKAYSPLNRIDPLADLTYQRALNMPGFGYVFKASEWVVTGSRQFLAQGIHDWTYIGKKVGGKTGGEIAYPIASFGAGIGSTFIMATAGLPYSLAKISAGTGSFAVKAIGDPAGIPRDIGITMSQMGAEFAANPYYSIGMIVGLMGIAKMGEKRELSNKEIDAGEKLIRQQARDMRMKNPLMEYTYNGNTYVGHTAEEAMIAYRMKTELGVIDLPSFESMRNSAPTYKFVTRTSTSWVEDMSKVMPRDTNMPRIPGTVGGIDTTGAAANIQGLISSGKYSDASTIINPETVSINRAIGNIAMDVRGGGSAARSLQGLIHNIENMPVRVRVYSPPVVVTRMLTQVAVGSKITNLGAISGIAGIMAKSGQITSTKSPLTTIKADLFTQIGLSRTSVLTSVKQTQLQSVKTMQIGSVKQLQVQSVKHLVSQNVLTKTIGMASVRTLQTQVAVQSVRQLQVQKVVGLTSLRMRMPNIEITGMPSYTGSDLGKRKGKKGRSKTQERGFAYVPSLTSASLGIYGKAPKGMLSSLNIRPIPGYGGRRKKK